MATICIHANAVSVNITNDSGMNDVINLSTRRCCSR